MPPCFTELALRNCRSPLAAGGPAVLGLLREVIYSEATRVIPSLEPTLSYLLLKSRMASSKPALKKTLRAATARGNTRETSFCSSGVKGLKT